MVAEGIELGPAREESRSAATGLLLGLSLELARDLLEGEEAPLTGF